MATQAKLMTADELLLLPDEGSRCELIDGALIEHEPEGVAHARYTSNLLYAMVAHARSKPGGLVVSNVGFRLFPDRETVLGPDVAWLPPDRVPPEAEQRGCVTGRPLIATEVVSPSNSLSEMQRKVLLHLTAGVSLVWIVDPPTRSVTVYSADGSFRLLSDDDVLTGGDVLSGFLIPLPDIFA